MSNLVPLIVAIPLGMGLLIPLLSRYHRSLTAILSNLVFFLLLVLSALLVGCEEFTYHVGGWPSPSGIELRIDQLTILLLITTNSLALIVGLYSTAFLQPFDSFHRYYSLLMFLVAGTNGVTVTGDLFNLYVFMELTAIASYALVAFGGQDEGLEASLKYMVLGGLASSAILIGIALTYAMAGTLNMTHLADRFSNSGSNPPLRFALALFLCGFGLKAALVPFHTWAADAYPAAPAPISAILAGVVSKVIGVWCR
jgi:multicomponent Na+:H+ antiporter subunit D